MQVRPLDPFEWLLVCAVVITVLRGVAISVVFLYRVLRGVVRWLNKPAGLPGCEVVLGGQRGSTAFDPFIFSGTPSSVAPKLPISYPKLYTIEPSRFSD